MMKNNIITVIVITMACTACRKYNAPPDKTLAQLHRRVDFVLYTTHQRTLSTDNHPITFTLRIRDLHGHDSDSVLAPMTVRDIPDFDHRLVFTRPVPDTQQGLLGAGFVYEITNVGIGPYIQDSVKAGQHHTVVNLDFQ